MKLDERMKNLSKLVVVHQLTVRAIDVLAERGLCTTWPALARPTGDEFVSESVPGNRREATAQRAHRTND